MKVYGLTGGIASGKSTVARMFMDLNIPVVDADALARSAVAIGTPGLAEIAECFGAEYLLESGELDRKKLARRIFADPDARGALNRITHPRIAALGALALEELAAKGHEISLYEAPLLVENNLHEKLAGTIVVFLDKETQRERLQERDKLTAEEVEQRIAAQASLERKLAVATHAINNGGTIAQTRAQVEEIIRDLLAKKT